VRVSLCRAASRSASKRSVKDSVIAFVLLCCSELLEGRQSCDGQGLPRCFKKNPRKAAPAAEDQPRAKRERHAPKQFNPMPDFEPDHGTWTRPMSTVHTMPNFKLRTDRLGGARGHETNHAACRRSRFSNKCRPFIRSFVRPTFIYSLRTIPFLLFKELRRHYV
jgi:hypothetical protein